MTVGGYRRLYILALLTGALVACSPTTAGNGTHQALDTPGPTSPISSDVASPSGGASASDTGSIPGTTSGTTAPTTSAAPPPVSAAKPPKQCPGGTCRKVASVELGDGYSFVLRANASYNGGFGAGIVELTKGATPVFWYGKDGESPGGLSCSTGGALPNCIVVAYVGAHGAVGTVWVFAGGTLHRGGAADSDSPNLQGKDLNGDGLVDVEALQNNYTPNYATGQVYWQTWLSDGAKLTSTGCGSPSKSPPPAPSAPLKGKCVA